VGKPYDARLRTSGTGTPVVFVPGINGTGDLFYRQLPRLEPTFTVATYAIRDDAPDHDVLADDLAAVIDAIAPAQRRAMVIAESFGGTVALACALRHPDKVSALVIVNSFCWFASKARLRLSIAGMTVVPWKALPFFRRLSGSGMHSPSTPKEDRQRQIVLTSSTSREAYLNRLRLLMTFDVRDRLGDIRQPALFLASEHDHVVPSVEQARYMSSRVPSGEMRILTNHGHACLVAPDLDLATIVRDWRR
jgi:pimeloyl-ACP methyl ester carboxylesterase